MDLEGETPLRVAQHGLHARAEVLLVLFPYAREAGLQETMIGLDVIISCEILARIDHLELIARTKHARLGIATLKSVFGG